MISKRERKEHEDGKSLLCLCWIDGEYYVYHKSDPKKLDMKDRLFEAIWYRKDKGIKLERGQVIKFGWI